VVRKRVNDRSPVSGSELAGASIRPRQPVRIAYLAHGVEGKRSGVRTKILSQAATWAELDPNVEVGVFVRCEAGAERDWRGEPHVVQVRSSRAGIAGRFIQRELLSLDLARWKPDLIYLRQSTVSPTVVVLAAALPTVVELNTLDLAELRVRSRLRYYYAKATRGLVLRRARGLVVVADEIARHPSVSVVGRPTTVVPNAVDLTRYQSMAPAVNATPRIVFLGAPHLPFHGLDKIERLACHFPSWTFDIIGPGSDELTVKNPNIHAHGLLDSVDYIPILARADVAIGPLAMYRKEMAEASPLKVAEYLAYGIPTIIGYTDTRFPSGAPFLLQIPNTETNVESSLEGINEFVLAWMGRRVDREAIASIDTRLVERRRLDFMLRFPGNARLEVER
jgi:glycosyltransferase involved in cell wall biosynthesis